MKLATDNEGKLRRFFSVSQIAQAVGVHEDTILRMIHRGEITAVRFRSSALRIPEAELERIMQRQREGREFKPETVSKFIPTDEAENPQTDRPPGRVSKSPLRRVRQPRRK